MQSSFAGLQRRAALAPAAPTRQRLVISAAHKKGAGSTKNGRDSESKRRGVKVYGGQEVKAGGIIVRQVGSTWYPGDNAALGKDYTLYSLIDGIVIFKKKETRSQIHVYPMDHEKAAAAVQATHTKAPKEGVPSRKERRAAMYPPRAEQRAAAMAAVVASPKP